MRERLAANNDAAATEMISALTEEYSVIGVQTAEDLQNGGARLVFETEEGGAVSLHLDSRTADRLAFELGRVRPQGRPN